LVFSPLVKEGLKRKESKKEGKEMKKRRYEEKCKK